MKRYFLVFALFIFSTGLLNQSQAQIKIGYVNTDRILAEFEEARQAQEKLDIEARKIEREYTNKLAKLDSLEREFERQKLVMSETRRTDKQREIDDLRRSIQDFQVLQMGPEGEIYKKQAELVGPVLEKIKRVIEKVGRDNKYDYIFDTVAGNILYAEPAHDLTDKVLYELERMQ